MNHCVMWLIVLFLGSSTTTLAWDMTLVPPLWYPASLGRSIGNGERNVVFDVRRNFSIESAGIEFAPLAGGARRIRCNIWEVVPSPVMLPWAGVRRALLKSATAPVANKGLSIYHVPIQYGFVAGRRYALGFESVEPPGWGNYLNEMTLYRYDPSEPGYSPYTEEGWWPGSEASFVKVLDGGFNADFRNRSLPKIQLSVGTLEITNAAPMTEELGAVRFRSFGNTRWEELLIGIPALPGAPAGLVPRFIGVDFLNPDGAEPLEHFVWGSSNIITFRYDAAGDKLIATVDLFADGSVDIVQEYPQFGSRLPLFGKGYPISQANQVNIGLFILDSGAAVALTDITINSQPVPWMGILSGSPGMQYSVTRTIRGMCFGKGFEIRAKLHLVGPFASDAYYLPAGVLHSRVDISIGVTDAIGAQCVQN